MIFQKNFFENKEYELWRIDLKEVLYVSNYLCRFLDIFSWYVGVALTVSPFCLVLVGKYFNVHDSIQREVDKRDAFMAKHNFRWNEVSDSYDPTNGTNIELYEKGQKWKLN